MKVWNVFEIRDLMERNDKVLISCMLSVYAMQTNNEKLSHNTKENNGVGFNGLDAPILTSFCEFYKQRGFLSPKQIAIARKKMLKYSAQATKYANDWEEKKVLQARAERSF